MQSNHTTTMAAELLPRVILRAAVFILSALIIIAVSTMMMGAQGKTTSKEDGSVKTSSEPAQTKPVDLDDSYDDRDDHHDDHDHKLHKSHTHGIVQLEVAVGKGNELHFQISVPLEALVGFEHKPKTKQQQASLDQAKATFMNTAKVLKLSDGLKNCEQTLADYDVIYTDAHAEATYKLQFKCKGEVTAQSATIVLGDEFKGIKEMHLKYIPKQGSAKAMVHKKFPFKITF